MLRSNKDVKGSGKINIISLLAVIAICFVVVGIIFSVLPHPCGVEHSLCQSNLNQLGKALKSYASDWDDKFPSNLTLGGTLRCEVRLSQNSSKNFKPFRYGQNWVEALYPYVERVGSPNDNNSVWKCPKIKNTANDGTAGSSYAMNFNLVGQSETVLKLASNTVMIREMDRLCEAVCRPINRCTTSKTPPEGAFLTEDDPIYGKCSPKLHGSGSNILFADGHVQTVQLAQTPETFTVAENWDKKTKHWWNSLNPDHMTIVINP